MATVWELASLAPWWPRTPPGVTELLQKCWPALTGEGQPGTGFKAVSPSPRALQEQQLGAGEPVQASATLLPVSLFPNLGICNWVDGESGERSELGATFKTTRGGGQNQEESQGSNCHLPPATLLPGTDSRSHTHRWSWRDPIFVHTHLAQGRPLWCRWCWGLRILLGMVLSGKYVAFLPPSLPP